MDDKELERMIAATQRGSDWSHLWLHQAALA